MGEPVAGDRVLLNVGALMMGLGTGGYAMGVALPDRLPADPPADGTTRDSGHLVKARYTPLQPILLGVDEEASPHREVMAAAESLDGIERVADACRVDQLDRNAANRHCFGDQITRGAGHSGNDRPLAIHQPVE